MENGGYDDGVRWSLVQPSGLMGLVETLVHAFEWWLGARIRARAMTEMVTAIITSGARAEVVVAEDSSGAHWTVAVDPLDVESDPVQALAEASEA
jgi:hypothetical protein